MSRRPLPFSSPHRPLAVSAQLDTDSDVPSPSRYTPPVDDTSPEAAKRYYELLKQQSPAARLSIAVSLTRTVRELATADILRREPNLSPRQIQARLAERLYGKATASRLFPPLERP